MTWAGVVAGLVLVAIGCAGGSEMTEDRGAPLAPCPGSPNCVSSQAADAAHRVEPFALRAPAAEVWPELTRTVASMPRTRIVAEQPGYLRAEATSRLFRFVDDLEIVLAADGRRLDIRSASRVGYSDLGANRKRVEALRTALREAGVVE
jgi:uncharacterized protein (DUF1499 family)